MGLVVKGLDGFEAIAARRFDKSLRIALVHFGLDVEITRVSSSVPQHENILVPHNKDAADMYQVGSGLGQVDVIGHAKNFSSDEGVVKFTARIVASHHLYASTDGFSLMDFESIYFFTLDEILPEDNLKFSRNLDNLVRAYLVQEVELVGTAETSGKRLLMSSLQDEASFVI